MVIITLKRVLWHPIIFIFLSFPGKSPPDHLIWSHCDFFSSSDRHCTIADNNKFLIVHCSCFLLLRKAFWEKKIILIEAITSRCRTNGKSGKEKAIWKLKSWTILLSYRPVEGLETSSAITTVLCWYMILHYVNIPWLQEIFLLDEDHVPRPWLWCGTRTKSPELDHAHWAGVWFPGSSLSKYLAPPGIDLCCWCPSGPGSHIGLHFTVRAMRGAILTTALVSCATYIEMNLPTRGISKINTPIPLYTTCTLISSHFTRVRPSRLEWSTTGMSRASWVQTIN